MTSCKSSRQERDKAARRDIEVIGPGPSQGYLSVPVPPVPVKAF